MKEYKSRALCYTIENKEYEMNLHCEKKFIAIVNAYQNGLLYHKEMIDQCAGTKYESVCDCLSVDMLSKYKDKVLKDEFRAFVRVHAD